MFEGPTEYVCECNLDGKSLHGIEWNMVYGRLDYSQNPLLGGRPSTKSRDHGTLNAHNHAFISIIMCEDVRE